jgi:hypothetical protein
MPIKGARHAWQPQNSTDNRDRDKRRRRVGRWCYDRRELAPPGEQHIGVQIVPTRDD